MPVPSWLISDVSQKMTEIVLRPSGWKISIPAAAGLLAAFPSLLVMLGVVERRFDGRDFVCLVLSAGLLTYVYFASRRFLRIGANALQVRERFSSDRFTLWADIEQIGVAAFPSTARGRKSFHYLAGIRLREGAQRADSRECLENRRACGYDILLEPRYNMSLERFITLLNEKKNQAKRG